MTTPLLLTLPWVALLAFLLLVMRTPRELPSPPAWDGVRAPLVSVIVPARNEADNIERCVGSLTAQAYPAFEVIVVDDGSDDGTGELARRLAPGATRRLQVVEGAPLPAGWLGKPWACWQGFGAARGELLLFTDADTIHGPELLGRAVAGLQEEQADLLTLVGTQLMGTLWERLVQPQIFFLMYFRFPRFEQTAKNARWRDAVANGQYLLFPRGAYERIGGHEAVRDEVVEDLALAQHVKRAGLRLRIRGAESDLSTRMYRSLRQLVDGWSKNIVTGGLQTVPAWLRPFLAPVSFLVGTALWLVPPALLVAAPLGLGGEALLLWSATAYGVSALLWCVFTHRMGAPAAYGLVYPIGAAVGAYIFVRSWIGGRRVAWKGRRYVLPPVSERP
ncbi:MAG TPA: glycosyltransferase family 2 protein [Longimicrobiales bacterium]|nr:glycosyltransferase family 2 protein [Longimicrobiales bacterium]